MAHLSPSTIFSPSVARQHLATSKDWNHIDAWLTAKYHPKAPPPIERTPETLKALLTLSSLNETTDEELELLHQSTLRAISTLSDQNRPNDNNNDIPTNTDIISALSENLSREGSTALETISTLSLLLNIQDGDASQIAQKIINLQNEEFTLDQATARVATMHQYLSTEHSHITTTISDLESPSYQPSEDLARQTQEYTRKAKALSSKLPEIQNQSKTRSSSTEKGGAGSDKYPTIQEIIEEEKEFKDLMKEVRDLEGQVRGYHGLPNDTDLARLEVEGLRVELRELVRRRDELFEGLVERETPRKGR